jgi:hypothetical protein
VGEEKFVCFNRLLLVIHLLSISGLLFCLRNYSLDGCEEVLRVCFERVVTVFQGCTATTSNPFSMASSLITSCQVGERKAGGFREF